MEIINDKIVLKTSKDAIFNYDEGAYSVNLYVPPYGEKQINEVTDVIYKSGNFNIPYHCNTKGTETFLIMKGRIEVIINAKKCICVEGDFINIPAHCPYSITTLEDNCVIRGIYSELNMSSKYKDMKLLSQNRLDFSYDIDFIKNDYYEKHNYTELTPPVETDNVEKSSLHQITVADEAVYEYDGWEGIKCKLKVGRWNLNRLKEIWEFDLEKDYQMQYLKPNAKEALYGIKSGKIKIEVNGDILFAETGDIVNIPHYTPYVITAMTSDVVLHDYNVSSRLFRMLEMLELAQRDEVDKIADPEWLQWLLDMNDCYLTRFGKDL